MELEAAVTLERLLKLAKATRGPGSLSAGPGSDMVMRFLARQPYHVDRYNMQEQFDIALDRVGEVPLRHDDIEIERIDHKFSDNKEGNNTCK